MCIRDRHKGEEIWFPAHTRRTISQLMPGDRVALYPKLMNSIIGKQKVSSFHVSDLARYKQLKKVIGKKKSISTFSHVGKGSGLDKAKGIQTMGGLAFHIEGFLLGRSWDDIMSAPDKTGRRWVNIEKVVGEDSEYAFRGELEKKKLTRRDYNERLEKATKHLQNDERSYIEVQKDVKNIGIASITAAHYWGTYPSVTIGNEKVHTGISTVSLSFDNPVDELFKNFQPDIVIHTAASYKDPNDWYNDTLTNCVGGGNIISASIKYNINRFIYFQTSLTVQFLP